MQKGFAHLIILISIVIIALIALIAGGAYYLGTRKNQTIQPIQQITQPITPTSTPDPTANWKTLEGPHSTVQEPPYSFQYPETWVSSTDIKDDPSKYKIFYEIFLGSRKLLITKDFLVSDSNPPTILKGAFIDTFSESTIFESNKSFDENLVDFDANFSSNKLQLIKEEKFSLDGQPARKRIEKSTLNHWYVEVVFEYPNNTGYNYLTLVSSPNDLDQNQIIFDKILSTFKFLE